MSRESPQTFDPKTLCKGVYGYIGGITCYNLIKVFVLKQPPPSRPVPWLLVPWLPPVPTLCPQCNKAAK